MADKKTTTKPKKVEKAEIVKPQYLARATEKAYVLQTMRTYIIQVPLAASKQEIAKEVEKAFNVTVEDVRVVIRKGKKTRFSRGKHAYPGITHRRDHKFAYVTLKEGDKIKKGDLIGYAGECAFGTSLKTKHLHFEVYQNGEKISPYKYLSVSDK